MKKMMGCIAVLLMASTSFASNLWQELHTTRIHVGFHTFDRVRQSVNAHEPDRTYRFEIFTIVDLYRDVSMNLDNTLFGRANKIGNVDTTAQIKTAWEEGYTGNRMVIGVLGSFLSGPRQTIALNNLNSSSEAGVLIKRQTTVAFLDEQRRPYRGLTYHHNWRFRFSGRSANNGKYNQNLNMAQLSSALAGGKHIDRDGTMLLGIAKGAIMKDLEADNSDWGPLLANQFHLDFISSNVVANAPSTRMTDAYTSLANSGRYGAGHLPLLVSPAGDDGMVADATAIAAGTANAANFINTAMAMSTQRVGGTNLSDYIVIAGGVVDSGNGTYAVAGNTPGEITALQNRWIVAPYTYGTDSGDVSSTALSAAFVSGMAAIVKDKFPQLSPAEVGNVLLDTARDLGTAGTDEVYGRGMIDLNNALSPMEEE